MQLIIFINKSQQIALRALNALEINHFRKFHLYVRQHDNKVSSRVCIFVCRKLFLLFFTIFHVNYRMKASLIYAWFFSFSSYIYRLCVILVYFISVEAKLNLFCDFSASFALLLFNSHTLLCKMCRLRLRNRMAEEWVCVHNGEVACNLTTCVHIQIYISYKNLPLADEINFACCWCLLIWKRERKSILFHVFRFSWINCLHGYIYEAFILKKKSRRGERWDEKGFHVAKLVAFTSYVRIINLYLNVKWNDATNIVWKIFDYILNQNSFLPFIIMIWRIIW